MLARSVEARLPGGPVKRRRGEGRPAAVPVKLGVVDGAIAELLEGDVREGDRLELPAGGGR